MRFLFVLLLCAACLHGHLTRATNVKAYTSEQRKILGYSRQHFINRLRDPLNKVLYHNGKNERGEVLQKEKWNMSYTPPIEVEAYLLKKRRLHAARRAVEGAIMRKEHIFEQMKLAVQAAKQVLREPRSKPIVRRLHEHFQKTGRRLATFVSPEKKQNLPLDSAPALRFEISRNRLRHLSSINRSPRKLNQQDPCDLASHGRTWMQSQCVDKTQESWMNLDGMNIGGMNLCQACNNPGQLCHNVASCNEASRTASRAKSSSGNKLTLSLGFEPST